MSQLFQSVCKTLERQPYSTTKSTENIIPHVINQNKFYGIQRTEALKTPSSRAKLIQAIKDCGPKGQFTPNISQTTNRQKALYDSTGWKYTEELLEQQRDKGGRFFSVLVELGERELRSKKTAELGKAVAEKLVRENHGFYAVERMDSLQSIIHLHILVLLPDDFSFPEKVCLGRGKYTVKYRELGKGQYEKFSLYENVSNFLHYLLKPSDARTHKGKGKGRYWKQFWCEWFENELRTEQGKKPLWEKKVTLRGAINLDISWLRDLDRAELESRYQEPHQQVSILHGEVSVLTVPAPRETSTNTAYFQSPDLECLNYFPALPALPVLCCAGGPHENNCLELRT